MRRVAVIGTSGAGKSTVAAALAARLGVPHVELDAIYHQAGWTPLPVPEFQARVAALVAEDGWVVDGNYSAVRSTVWARADTVVWLDSPRWRTMAQLGTRTFGRWALRRELWNGNREQLRNLLSRDRERNILLWGWSTYSLNRTRYDGLEHDPAWAHLQVVRLRRRRDAADFLRTAG